MHLHRSFRGCNHANEGTAALLKASNNAALPMTFQWKSS